MEGFRFRFRWRRRQNWGVEVYDAFDGGFRVVQVTYDPGTRLDRPDLYRWILCAFYMGNGRVQPTGRAGSPREAARQAEAAFDIELPNALGFCMRTERAIEFCRHFGIRLPAQTRWQAENFGLMPAAGSPAARAATPPGSASRES